ncbi:MAG: hypothetical protein ACP5G2_00100 [Candidatus Bipolaricaulaceae bacterium]
MVRGTDKRTGGGWVWAAAVALLAGWGCLAQTGWRQVNEDGFGYPASGSSVQDTRLVASGNLLLAWNEHGVFQLDDPLCAGWRKISPPVSQGLIALDGYIYGLSTSGTLYWIQGGADPGAPANWHAVISYGVPGGASPIPKAVFNGKVYGVYRYSSRASGAGSFEIWRSPDLGKTTMWWTKVVANAFGDPQNNRDVDFIGGYNGRIYVGTQALQGMFGDTAKYVGGGSEVLESTTGNLGTWVQVNVDGFGTEVSQPITGLKLRTNRVIGCWAVYKGHLYVGTKSHLGAEVWRYNGAGKAGWQNVTPPGAGPSPFLSSPGRNNAMLIYGNQLYLADGVMGGRLLRYDGANWTVVVSGPNPFHSENGGLSDLAVAGGKLYASARKSVSLGAVTGDQVWGYPFPYYVAAVACQGPKTILPQAERVPVDSVKLAVIPDVSGQWTSLFGVTYHITQQGTSFTWYAPTINETGSGTVFGTQITASWSGDLGSGAGTGTVTLGAGNLATLIQWSNGNLFFR